MVEAVDQRIVLEAALVRLANAEADTSPAALLERIERLEAALAAGGVRPPGSPAACRAGSSGRRPADAARQLLRERRGDAARPARPAQRRTAASGTRAGVRTVAARAVPRRRPATCRPATS